jgi:DNA-binding FadR family transcriptional regulator
MAFQAQLLRKIFEPRAAALAAARATPKDLRDIEDHLLKMAAHITNIAVREQQDFLFHDAIIRAAKNRVLTMLAQSLEPLLIRSRQLTGQTHHDMNRIISQHKAIFESIRIRNSELAEEAMRQHLLGVGIDLISEREHQPRDVGP